MGGRGGSVRRDQASKNLSAMKGDRVGGMDAPLVHQTGTKKMSRLESNIAGHQYEIGAVYTKKGKNVTLVTNKAKSSVSFGHMQSRKMAGAILTHNHPSHSGLSSQDIKSAALSNLKQVRAVGRNPKTGKTVHHIITRKGSQWKTNNEKSIERSFRNGYIREYIRTGSHHKSVIAANKSAAETVGGRYRTREIKDTWTSKKQRVRNKKNWKKSEKGILFQ